MVYFPAGTGDTLGSISNSKAHLPTHASLGAVLGPQLFVMGSHMGCMLITIL